MVNELLMRMLDILDSLYLRFDRWRMQRANNIIRIPSYYHRRGGKQSYAEWGFVIGIFQTLIYQYLPSATGNRILDIGCGTGLLGIACEPFTRDGGKYVGLDVSRKDIAFSRKHYPYSNWNFKHLDIHNATYAPDQTVKFIPWPLDDNSFDMVLALSVWTHMRPDDAVYYFREVERVLKPGCHALITFFLLDADYKQSLLCRSEAPGRFHLRSQAEWIFDQRHPEEAEWYYPSWVHVPEDAIGLTPAALDKLLDNTTLQVVKQFPGNWKERPGVYFQDVIIFQKPE